MVRTQYFVTHHQGQWNVVLNSVPYGPHPNQKAAIRAAVEAAHQTPNSQVMVQNHLSQWRAEWTYGNDPYPPPG